MRRKNSTDDLSIEEIKRQISIKQQVSNQKRWQRLKQAGRIVDIQNYPPPVLSTERLPSNGRYSTNDLPRETAVSPPLWRRLTNRLLLLVEVMAVISLIIIGASLLLTRSELNQEVAQVQSNQGQELALPTPTAPPIIDVVILPGGHKPPVAGIIPEPGEAGNIPAHLLPAINNYTPPELPTPFPEQARRIEIPAIQIDSPVVQGMYDWEQLKKGVAQKIDSAAPGQKGNLALAGHNDIYGEIFRNLDKLTPGDEIIVSTEIKTYTYLIRETQVVDPTEVWVLEPTTFATTTLISCYPYRVNNKRIVVFADLVETS